MLGLVLKKEHTTGLTPVDNHAFAHTGNQKGNQTLFDFSTFLGQYFVHSFDRKLKWTNPTNLP